MAKVLISDKLAKEGIEILSEVGQVDVNTGLPEDELVKIIGEYDALVVRSQTQVTRKVLEAGKKLRVVGRAGVGVDNIDLQAATENGIIVVNAPMGNTISAAEQAIALMMAMSRNIPDAVASTRQGKWERSKFTGIEVRGKTLGVVGLGQVGSEVAKRGRGLEMRVLGFDPFVSEERAQALGIELMTLEDLLAESDFISLHATLNASTRGMINEERLAMMKKGVRIINTGRGALIDDEALLRAIEDGKVAAAALDVFAKEPIDPENPLLKNDKIMPTPHLGASTTEAQEKVALDVAHEIVAILGGKSPTAAVNAPLIAPETMTVIGPYMEVAEKIGNLATQLSDGQLENIEIEYGGEIANHDVTLLRAAVIRGLLATVSEENVTIVNANLVAERRGLNISERMGAAEPPYANLIEVCVKTKKTTTKVAGSIGPDGAHIVQINDFWVDVPPGDGHLLVCENLDRPGMVGAIGTLLGKRDVNISFMRLGRDKIRGKALMVLGVDDVLSDEVMTELHAVQDVYTARVATL